MTRLSASSNFAGTSVAAPRSAAAPIHARASQLPVSALQRIARGQLFARLAQLSGGHVTWIDADGAREFGPAGHELSARVQVEDPDLYIDLVLGGSVGAAEAFMAGAWRCDDLVSLVRILVRDRGVLGGLESGMARLAQPGLKALHALRSNTRAGSRKNIAAHYDLGNEFYRLFLDDSMMYSCAIFERADDSLEQAQLAKLEHICRKLDLRPGEQLLEIGTGWGALAMHAAAHHGARVTTTTISREQHDLAVERIRRAGLSDRITVLFEDYRDLRGQYDKLVSIEMIEAVGEGYLDTYMRQCSDLLAPHGAMLLQAITIQDQFYAQALRNVDFIQKHIFPGSFIPSVGAIAERTTRVSDMKIAHLEDIGAHYAPTLRAWRTRFLARLDEVRAQGFDERFARMWEYYLAYCEGGFEERVLGDVQILLAKPRNRRAPLLAAQA